MRRFFVIVSLLLFAGLDARSLPGVTVVVPGQPGMTETVPGQPGVTETVSGQPGMTETVSGQPGVTETVSGQPGVTVVVPGQPGMTNRHDRPDSASQRFVSYSAAEGLPSNTVYAITQDADGILWVGTRGGLSRFDGVHFETVIAGRRITSLAVDKENRVWAGTTDGLEVIAGSERHSSRPGDNIRALLADSDGYVWATVGDTLLLKLSYKDGIREVARSPYDKRDSEGDYPYYQIYEARDGKLWLAGRIVRCHYIENEDKPTIVYPFGRGGFCSGSYAEAGGKLFAFDDHASTLYTFEDGEAIPHGRLPIAHSRLLTDSHGRLWAAGSYGLGLVNTDHPEETVVFRHQPDDPSSIASGELYCIFEDRQGNIWVGGNNGLSVLSSALQHVKTISTAQVSALLEDHNGNIWIGKAEDRVSALYEDSAGTIYVGLWNNTGWEVWKGGKMYKDRLTGFTPEEQRPAAATLSGANWISDFLEDSRGRFWVVTWEGVGLNEWDRKARRSLPPRWLSPFRYPSPQVDSNIYVSSRLGSRLIEDRDGNLVYATTEAGLNIIDAGTGLVTKYYRGNSDIPDDYVTDLCLTPDGRLWAATRAGLWSPSGAGKMPGQAGHDGGQAGHDGRQIVLAGRGRQSLLHGKLVQSVLSDERGRLWAGTEDGLYFVDTDGSIGVVRRALGFPSDIYGERAACNLSGGRLAFGGPKGAVIFHPDSLLGINAAGNILLASLIRHRYRLNGGPWTEGTFAGLPEGMTPGRYTLQEQSSDIFGRWERGENSIRTIRVPLPLWLRWPFLILYALLLTAIVWTVIRLRERRLLVKELDMRNELFSIISHDLKGPISGNRFLSNQLLEQMESLPHEQLKEGIKELAASADNASSLLENLLLWSLNQKGMLEPVMREENLQDLFEEASRSIRSSGCIEIDAPDNLSVQTDRNMLLTCLRNLLDNAVKASPEGGKVALKVSGRRIILTDEGPGIQEGDQKWSHGLGLVITRELLEKMGATMQMRNRPEGGLEITIDL